MKGQIYLLIDTRNGKKYIGKHNGNKKNYFTGGLIPNKIIKKHGKDVFDRVILHDNIEEIDELNMLEKFYIEKFNTYHEGYNLTMGGDGGGDWIYLKDESTVEEIAQRKSLKMKNRVFSEETKQKMSLAKKGIKLSETHRENIKKAQSGENHPWYGKKHSDETKEKISRSKKGSKNKKLSDRMVGNVWNQVEVSIDGTIYTSISTAAKELGIAKKTIKNRLRSDKWETWYKIDKL